jgi:hypothetical protein
MGSKPILAQSDLFNEMRAVAGRPKSLYSPDPRQLLQAGDGLDGGAAPNPFPTGILMLFGHAPAMIPPIDAPTWRRQMFVFIPAQHDVQAGVFAVLPAPLPDFP